MYLTKEVKAEIFTKHGKSATDTGNSEGQIATTQRNKNNGKNFVLQPPLRAVPDQQDGQRVFF